MVIEGVLCRRWWWLRVTLGAHAETIGQVHEAIDGLAFALFPAPTSEYLLTLLDRVIRCVTRRLAATRPTTRRGLPVALPVRVAPVRGRDHLAFAGHRPQGARLRWRRRPRWRRRWHHRRPAGVRDAR